MKLTKQTKFRLVSYIHKLYIYNHDAICDQFETIAICDLKLLGGILVLWNDNVDLELVGQTRQEIHLRVKVSGHYVFFLSTIYCLSHSDANNILWSNLFTVSNSLDSPWLVVGDFNQITDSHEKLGGKQPSLKSCSSFISNINKCSLNDFGFHGSKYTWSNKRFFNKHSLIRERLIVSWEMITGSNSSLT